MALGTLAQPYAYNGSWVKGNGNNKGMWAYNGTSWDQVKELYAYDGSWNKVHPMHVTSCTVTVVSNGSCPSTNALLRINSSWQGPLPQFISGPDTSYFVQFYARTSSISQAHLESLSFTFRGTAPGMVSLTQNQNLGTGWVGLGSTFNRWVQGQVRMNHSIDGQLTGAQHVRSSIIRAFKADDCGPE